MTGERYRRFGKRLLDVAVSLIALVVLVPVMLVVAALVAVCLGRPVIFRQERPGAHGRPFELVKVRTMTDARDDHGNLRPDDERLTRFGRFLRSMSLDELPELLNVLRGEMSLVGPRPLLPAYLDLYSPQQARRHDVRPGLTGLAQVNGRNAVDWPSRFELDVWYVDNHTLWLDVQILARTAYAVLRQDGVNEPGCATMTEFRGNGSPPAPAVPEASSAALPSPERARSA
jgi:lipopolysaccharide/colanic/teichoic acid biosynthesis glycosyltransferase